MNLRQIEEIVMGRINVTRAQCKTEKERNKLRHQHQQDKEDATLMLSGLKELSETHGHLIQQELSDMTWITSRKDCVDALAKVAFAIARHLDSDPKERTAFCQKYFGRGPTRRHLT